MLETEFIKLLATDPLAAADLLDEFADSLRNRAGLIRQAAMENAKDPVDATTSKGGIGERVQMVVSGRDGSIKQSIDTGDLA